MLPMTQLWQESGTNSLETTDTTATCLSSEKTTHGTIVWNCF